MRGVLGGRSGTVIGFIVGALLATGATAGAASLITGKQIKDGSITANDLSRSLRTQIAKSGTAGRDGQTGAIGPVGPQGASGSQGPQGAPGQKGDAGPAPDTSLFYTKSETVRSVANRIALSRSSATDGTLVLAIAGIGDLLAFCRTSGIAEIAWKNKTLSNQDIASSGPGVNAYQELLPYNTTTVGSVDSGFGGLSIVSVAQQDDPGRVATLVVQQFSSGAGSGCRFAAHAIARPAN